MGRFRALVGGATAIQHGLFVDIPMHVDCAEYAIKVCPFLAAPKFAYSRGKEEIEGVNVTVAASMSTQRPLIFGLGITRSRPFYTRNGPDVVIKVRSWESVTWWQNGQKVEVQLGPRQS